MHKTSVHSKNFCPAPWYHSFVHADGSIRPCCVSWDKVGDTLKGDTIFSAWNGEAYQKIRRQFLDGNPPKGCESCFVKENAGIQSRRQYLTAEIEQLSEAPISAEIDTLSVEAELNIVSLDISLSNQCNLRCRFCGPYNSTKWIQNGQSLLKTNGKFWQNVFGTQTYKPIEQKTHAYKELLLNSKNLKHIELKGGEPFLLSEHIDFLKLLIDLQISQNISLAYSTNGTVIQPEVKELFSHFKSVSLTLSVDGTGGLYKYIRGEHFSLEEDVEKNIQFYRSIPNTHLSVTFTLNAYNIFGIKDFIDWHNRSVAFDSGWNLGIVAFPKPLRVSSVPLMLRKSAAQLLEGYSGANVERILQLLLAEDSDDIQNDCESLVEYIRDLDHLRNTNILDHVPEFREIMATSTFL